MVNAQLLLAPDRVLVHGQATSKKSVLELASELLGLGDATLDSLDILQKLLERERLGSTGVGHGVAIPHARLAIEQPLGCFVQLREAVHFDAIDDLPVDLLFAFIVPDHQTELHVQLIAHLATLFSNISLRAQLRQALDRDTLYQLLTGHQSP